MTGVNKMPGEQNFQKVLFEYTKNLDQSLLGRICLDHQVEVTSFLSWIRADKVRLYKMQEVTETRLVEMEKAK